MSAYLNCEFPQNIQKSKGKWYVMETNLKLKSLTSLNQYLKYQTV